jgi:sarcosine oxidase
MFAVIGLGSIGSMALWQASRLSDSVTGFEAASPAHGRSTVGGDTRVLRMLYRGNPDYYPTIRRGPGLRPSGPSVFSSRQPAS